MSRDKFAPLTEYVDELAQRAARKYGGDVRTEDAARGLNADIVLSWVAQEVTTQTRPNLLGDVLATMSEVDAAQVLGALAGRIDMTGGALSAPPTAILVNALRQTCAKSIAYQARVKAEGITPPTHHDYITARADSLADERWLESRRAAGVL